MHRASFLLVAICIAASFLSPDNATAQSPTAWPIASRPDALRLRVVAPGLQSISRSELIAAGWPQATDLSRVALWYRGVEHPLHQAGETLQFVARPERSRYHTESVYWLTRESRAGLRAPLELAPGQPIAWEDDALYESRVAAPNGDHWFAAELSSSDPNRKQVQPIISLPSAQPAGRQLQLDLASALSGEHRLAVSIGGQTHTLAWAGTGAYQGQITLPALPAGPLAITIELSSPADLVLLDRLELPEVAPAFSDQPARPVVERGAGIDLTRGPSASQRGASFLIITHALFQPTLAPLVAAHQRLGDTVAVVDVQAAYDAFSFGERNPEAIRSLIKLSQDWQPTPRSVLLVGAGNVRMREGQGVRPTNITIGARQMQITPSQAEQSFIPPYLVQADALRGEIACDTCYTRLRTVDPLEQLVPDLPIGRLPVRTLAEAQAVVAKTVRHLTAPPAGAWQSQALFLADNDREADGTPDPAGSFVQTAELGIAALPTGIQAQRFYYAPDREASGPYDPQIGRLRCRLFRAIDGGSKYDTNCPPLAAHQESGAALLTYVGHGSPWQWGFTSVNAPVSYLWYLYDADGRKNGDKLPILLALTCLSGDFANPVLMSNDERLVIWPNGGVVAALSSSGQGVNAGHAELLAGLMPQLFGAGDRSLGAAHLAGLARLRSQHHELAYAFNILGDPAVRLPFVPTKALFLPVVAR
jgi:hypothetical protein